MAMKVTAAESARTAAVRQSASRINEIHHEKRETHERPEGARTTAAKKAKPEVEIFPRISRMTPDGTGLGLPTRIMPAAWF